MSDGAEAPLSALETLPSDAPVDTFVTSETNSLFPLQRLFAAGLPGDPEVAPTIGRFSILHKLGQGGMGVVYLGYDARLDRRAAVKLLRAASSDVGRARMLREAQALARLSHPNVVQIYESGEHDDDAYIAMEFVDGLTLREWMGAETRSSAEILAVFVAAGRGLMAAHAQGLTHRDFKPDNVMIGDDGRVRVMDFGLVRTLDDAQDARDAQDAQDAQDAGSVRPRSERAQAEVDLTATGTLLGTPAYMAPEQIRGEHTGPQTDQFSFCVALWEALYGHRPFSGRTIGELSTNILERKIIEPSKDVHVPGRVREVLERGMAIDAEARWPSMDELLSVLDGQPPASRRRSLFVGAVLAFAVLFMAIGFAWQRSAALHEAQTHQREMDAEARAARSSVLLEEGDGVEALALAIGAVGSLPDESGALPAKLPSDVGRALYEANAADLSWGVIAELPGFASTAAFSPDGSWLALSQADTFVGIERHHIEIHDVDADAISIELSGHSCLIRTMQFNAHGSRLLASCYEQGGAHLWDVHSGELLASFDDGALLGFSPAASLLAIRDDQEVTLVDARTGAAATVLAGHAGAAGELAFSDDGARVAIAGPRDVRVWDSISASLVATLDHDGVLGLAWFADGSGRLATVAGDLRVHVWAAESGERLIELDAGPSPDPSPAAEQVHALVAAPDGSRVGLYVDREAWLWDTVTGERVAAFVDRAVNPLGNERPWVFDVEGEPLEFSADGSRMIMRQHDGTLRLHDGRTGAELIQTSLALSYAFSPDGELLAIGDDDVELLDSETGTHARTLPSTVPNITAFSPDGRLLATRGVDSNEEHCLLLWDTQVTPSPVTILDEVTRSDIPVAVAPTGGRLATVDGELARVWDAGSQRLLATLEGHVGGARVLEFSRDGAVLASIDGEHTLRVWDPATGELLAVPIAVPGPVEVGRGWDRRSPVALSDDGARIAVASATRVRVWDLESSTPIAEFEGRCFNRDVMAIEFAPSGEQVVIRDCELRMWSLSSGEMLAEFDELGFYSDLAFSPDGTRLSTSRGIVDVASGALITELLYLDNNSVERARGPATFSPDGALLIVGGELWDGYTGALLGSFGGHERPIDAVGFLDGGARVVTASRDAVIVRPATPLASACGRLRPYVAAYAEVATTCDAVLLLATAGDPQVPRLHAAAAADRRWLAGSVWALALLSLMLAIRLPDRIERLCAKLANQRLHAPAYHLCFAAMMSALALALVALVEWHLNAYSRIPMIVDWCIDARVLVGVALLPTALWWLLRNSPDRWWAWLSLASVAGAVGCLTIGSDLVQAVHELSVTGAPLLEALALPFEHVANVDGSAAFGGFAAHAQGHRALGHRWQSALAFVIVVSLGLFAVHRAGSWIAARHGQRLGFDSLSERGAVPLLLVLLVAFGLAAAPALNALARHQELEADRFALERSGDANSCAAHAVMRSRDSGLSEAQPGLASLIWQGRQPALGERIKSCL